MAEEGHTRRLVLVAAVLLLLGLSLAGMLLQRHVSRTRTAKTSSSVAPARAHPPEPQPLPQESAAAKEPPPTPQPLSPAQPPEAHVEVPPEVTALIEQLGSTDPDLRGRAAKGLGEMGEKALPAVPVLLSRLRDLEITQMKQDYFNLTVGWLAARAVGAIGEKALPELEQAVLAEEIGGFDNYATAFSTMKAEPDVEFLIRLAGHKNSLLRAYAVQKLMERGDKRAMGVLTERLDEDPYNHRSERIIVMAAHTLGHIKAEQAVPKLVARLGPCSYKWTLVAARALTEIGGKDCVSELSRNLVKLQGEPAALRADILGRLKAAEAVPVLTELLKSPYWQAREKAAEALGRIGDPRAREPVLAAVHDHDWRVREAALWSLGRMGLKDSPEPLLAAVKSVTWTTRWRAADALGCIGDDEAVQALISALEDEDWRVRWCATSALAKIQGDGAIEGLAKALESKEVRVSWLAADALGRRKGERALGAIWQGVMMPDKDWRVAEALERSQEALTGKPARLGDPRSETTTRLIGQLEQQKGTALTDTILALAGLKNPRAVPALTRLLEHSDKDVRRGAAAALGGIGDPRAAEPLGKLLTDVEEPVRAAAAAALGEIGDPRAAGQLAYLARERFGVPGAALAALSKVGHPRSFADVCDDYIGMAFYYDSRENTKAQETVKRLADFHSTEFILGHLEGTYERRREEMARLLADVESPQQVPFLLDALYSEERHVRDGAAEMLRKRLNEDVLKALVDELGDKNAYVVLRAQTILMDVGQEAVPHLEAALRHGDPEVRKRAADIIESIKTPAAVEVPAWLEADPASKDPRAAVLEAAVGNESAFIRASTAEELAELGGPHAAWLLGKMLLDKDRAVRSATLGAIGKLPGEEATKLLRLALKHPDWETRELACLAVTGVGRYPPRDFPGFHGLDSLADKLDSGRLGKLDAAGLRNDLCSAVHDEVPFVRVAAIRSLGYFNKADNVPDLLGALRDEHWEVRYMATWALSRFIGFRTARTETTDRIEAAMVELFKDEDVRVKRAAAEALRYGRNPALAPVMVEVLAGDDGSLYWCAREFLGRMGDPTAGEAVVRAVREGKMDVFNARFLSMHVKPEEWVDLLIEEVQKRGHTAAADLLAAAGEPRAIPVLVEALNASHGKKAAQLARALGQLKWPQAFDVLMDALKSSDYEARYAAACALAVLHDPRAFDALCHHAVYQEREAREVYGGDLPQFARALGELRDPRAVPHLVKALRTARGDNAEGIADALKALTGLSNGTDQMEKQWVIYAGDSKQEQKLAAQQAAREQWDKWLEEHRQELDRLGGIASRGGKGDGDIGSALAMLEHDDQGVRSLAVCTVGYVKAEAAVEPLVALVQKDRTIHENGTWALMRIGGERAAAGAVALLLEMDAKAAEALLKELPRMKGASGAVPVLIAYLSDKRIQEGSRGNLQRQVIDAMGRIGDKRAVEALIPYLGSEDQWTRRGAAAALGNLKDARATAPLAELLNDSFVRETAATALDKITGLDLGRDPEAWKKWWEQNKDKHIEEAR